MIHEVGGKSVNTGGVGTKDLHSPKPAFPQLSLGASHLIVFVIILFIYYTITLKGPGWVNPFAESNIENPTQRRKDL